MNYIIAKRIGRNRAIKVKRNYRKYAKLSAFRTVGIDNFIKALN